MTRATVRQVPVLDGLRGLAALIVMVSHGANLWASGALVGQGAGHIGVMLFFVLSGFLMGYLYLHRACTGASSWQFFLNRAGRVVPLYFAVVLFSFFAHYLNASFWTYPIETTGTLFAHLGFVSGVDVLWSIGPEILFYCFFACLWFLMTRSRSIGFLVGAVALLVSVLPVPVVVPTNSLAQLQSKLPFFMVGMALGASWDPSSWARPSASIRLVLIAISTMILFASFPQILPLIVQTTIGVKMAPLGPPWIHLWGIPYYFLVVLSFFAATLWLSPSWLASKPMRKAGELSYAIYLVHRLVLNNIPSVEQAGWPVAIAMYVLGTLSVAYAVHLVVERPARRWFRNMTQRREPAVQSV